MQYSIVGEMMAGVSGDYFVKTGNFPCDLELSANYTAHCGSNIAPQFMDIQMSENGFRFHVELPPGESTVISWSYSVGE